MNETPPLQVGLYSLNFVSCTEGGGLTRRIIGWSTKGRVKSELAVYASGMPIKRRHPHGGVIHNSDHDSQYTSIVFTDTMMEAGILGSMGFVRDALDNAIAESFYSTLQTELLGHKQLANTKKA